MNFCDTLIVRFKNLVIAKLLNKSEESITVKKDKHTIDINKEVLSRLAFLVKDLKEYIQGLKKVKKSPITKGELLEIIKGLAQAIKNQDVCYIKPFIMAVKTGQGKDKEIQYRLVEILDIVNKSFIDA